MASSVWKGDEKLEKLQVTHLRLHELAAAVLINQNTKCTTLNIELSLDSFFKKGDDKLKLLQITHLRSPELAVALQIKLK